MEISRRDFLKLSGAGIGGAWALTLPFSGTALASPFNLPEIKRGTETTTVCCYCSVGCGAIVTAYEDGKIKIEGDPDHPINQGSLCPKGLAMSQVHQVDGKLNPQRLTTPWYRAPGAVEWDKTKTWEEIIPMIANRIKTTRDNKFITNDSNGKTVNRCENIGQFGGGELDNEECYLATKMARALGLVFVEHCARL